MSEDSSELLAKLLRGETEYVVSHPGRSQYSAQGSGASACGLAALNCARLVLQNERNDGAGGEKVLNQILQREFSEEILSICLQWASVGHLDVEEIHAAPVFNQSLILKWSDYEQPGFEQFKALLERVQQSTELSAVLVITRPPEIISALKVATSSAPVFVTFDSHPRKKHPDGAAFIFHPSLDAAAAYLSDLLQFDPQLLSDPNLHWQAQLLAHCSAHMFVAREMSTSAADLDQILLDTSLEVLKLKAEISDLNTQVSSLDAENRHLASENATQEAKIEDLQEENRRLVRKSTFSGSTHGAPSLPLGGPPVSPSAPRAGPVTLNGTSSSQVSQATLNAGPSTSKGSLVWKETQAFGDDDATFATLIELEWRNQAEDRDSLDFKDFSLAQEQQKAFEDEDRALREQAVELQKTVPATFQCGICLEEETEFMLQELEPCGHKFCRSCVREYLRSKLGEHRFPILCPICAADRGSGEPGTISSVMAQIVGLNEEEYALFTELELASFSVLLHCRKCEEAVFVDKDEFNEAKVLVCPLRGCNHIWCKACSRTIEIGGPPHSCDGSSELTHLMRAQGWKNCPGCSSPIQKVDGCNHMTCIAPGCNTHFCYACGQTIVQSVRRQDIRTALNTHYSRCRLIEVPPELV